MARDAFRDRLRVKAYRDREVGAEFYEEVGYAFDEDADDFWRLLFMLDEASGFDVNDATYEFEPEEELGWEEQIVPVEPAQMFGEEHLGHADPTFIIGHEEHSGHGDSTLIIEERPDQFQESVAPSFKWEPQPQFAESVAIEEPVFRHEQSAIHVHHHEQPVQHEPVRNEPMFEAPAPTYQAPEPVHQVAESFSAPAENSCSTPDTPSCGE